MKRKKASRMHIILIGGILILLIYCGDTPYRNSRKLVKAIKEENIPRVEQLLEKGVDPNVGTLSPLGDILLGFVESGPERPLAKACEGGNLQIVELLIQYGATAEPDTKFGWSPLYETIFYYQPDDVEIVNILLKNGTNTTDDIRYELPVFWAAEMFPCDYDPEKSNGTYLKDEYSEDAAKGITEIIKILLDERSVDIQNTNGTTLLIFAVKSENIYLAKYLISEGCDTQIRDGFDKSAYEYALETNNSELIRLFEKSK